MWRSWLKLLIYCDFSTSISTINLHRTVWERQKRAFSERRSLSENTLLMSEVRGESLGHQTDSNWQDGNIKVIQITTHYTRYIEEHLWTPNMSNLVYRWTTAEDYTTCQLSVGNSGWMTDVWKNNTSFRFLQWHLEGKVTTWWLSPNWEFHSLPLSVPLSVPIFWDCFQQDNAPSNKAQITSNLFLEHNSEFTCVQVSRVFF